MQDKIKARIEQLKTEHTRMAQAMAEEANLRLAPYVAAIKELEALLEAEPEPEQDD
jgi:hypothetical protein